MCRRFFSPVECRPPPLVSCGGLGLRRHVVACSGGVSSPLSSSSRAAHKHVSTRIFLWLSAICHLLRLAAVGGSVGTYQIALVWRRRPCRRRPCRRRPYRVRAQAVVYTCRHMRDGDNLSKMFWPFSYPSLPPLCCCAAVLLCCVFLSCQRA